MPCRACHKQSKASPNSKKLIYLKPRLLKLGLIWSFSSSSSLVNFPKTRTTLATGAIYCFHMITALVPVSRSSYSDRNNTNDKGAGAIEWFPGDFPCIQMRRTLQRSLTLLTLFSIKKSQSPAVARAAGIDFFLSQWQGVAGIFMIVDRKKDTFHNRLCR